MGVLTSKPVQVSPLSLGFPTLYTVLLANAGTSAELSALDGKGLDFKSDPSPMRNQPTIGRVPCDRKSAGSKVCPPHFGEMPSELRPSAGLSSWASATPAENSANLQRAARWCGAKAAPQANTRLRGYLSWWGSDRRGHDQTAWHGAHHHDQRQRDQKMLRRTDKEVTFLFVGIFVGTFRKNSTSTEGNSIPAPAPQTRPHSSQNVRPFSFVL